MSNIIYTSDFLASSLRPGVLYELVISLAVEISEIAFKNIITQLNLQFISPRVVFSGLHGPELTIYYSTSDSFPAISQQEIVFALMTAFDDYSPSILYEESPGEIPGGVPLIPVKATEPRALFSPEWIEEGAKELWQSTKQGYEDFIEAVSEKTGLPKWSVPYILGGSAITAILVILYVKTKPVLVIKTKKS